MSLAFDEYGRPFIIIKVSTPMLETPLPDHDLPKPKLHKMLMDIVVAS